MFSQVINVGGFSSWNNFAKSESSKIKWRSHNPKLVKAAYSVFFMEVKCLSDNNLRDIHIRDIV